MNPEPNLHNLNFINTSFLKTYGHSFRDNKSRIEREIEIETSSYKTRTSCTFILVKNLSTKREQRQQQIQVEIVRSLKEDKEDARLILMRKTRRIKKNSSTKHMSKTLQSISTKTRRRSENNLNIIIIIIIICNSDTDAHSGCTETYITSNRKS
jgi:hypothetical protein